MKKILVTGGAGYIGSHTLIELATAGYEFVVADNFCNSNPESLKRVSELIGREVKYYNADIRDKQAMEQVMRENDFFACIHFAGLKAVGESVAKPYEYYENNIAGTLVLIDALRKHNCKNIIFSSSATVYGNPAIIPITEECPKGYCTNPYGQTKSMLEEIFMDIQKADPEWNIVLLRYFNPIGAHKSGRIGEDPNGIPNNLMPYISQVAVGRRDHLTVFGNDYDTPDGTCRRDYIHVMDLAAGHVLAAEYAIKNTGTEIINLGTGTPYSVLEMVDLGIDDLTEIFPILKCAWSEMKVKTFNANITVDSKTGELYIWGNLDFSYNHLNGGSNGAHILDFNYSKSEGWKIITDLERFNQRKD